jgi:hypothetical protein
MNMCPIPDSFRDRNILLYTCKIVDKKAILRMFVIMVVVDQVRSMVQFT